MEETVPIADVSLNRHASTRDNTENIPEATCDEWCERISTPSQQVRAEDLQQILDYSFMKKESCVPGRCTSFRQELELTAKMTGKDLYVVACWMLADEMEEKYLVEIMREGSALLQDPVGDRVASLKKIDSYFLDVRKQYRICQAKKFFRSCQLERDLRSMD